MIKFLDYLTGSITIGVTLVGSYCFIRYASYEFQIMLAGAVSLSIAISYALVRYVEGYK